MIGGDPLSQSLIDAAERVSTGQNTSDSCKRVDEGIKSGKARDIKKQGGSVDLAGTDLEKIINTAFKRQAAHLEIAFVKGGTGGSAIAVTMLRVDMDEIMKAAKMLKTKDVSIGAQTRKGKKINGGVTVLFSGIK